MPLTPCHCPLPLAPCQLPLAPALPPPESCFMQPNSIFEGASNIKCFIHSTDGKQASPAGVEGKRLGRGRKAGAQANRQLCRKGKLSEPLRVGTRLSRAQVCFKGAGENLLGAGYKVGENVTCQTVLGLLGTGLVGWFLRHCGLGLPAAAAAAGALIRTPGLQGHTRAGHLKAPSL